MELRVLPGLGPKEVWRSAPCPTCGVVTIQEVYDWGIDEAGCICKYMASGLYKNPPLVPAPTVLAEGKEGRE